MGNSEKKPAIRPVSPERQAMQLAFIKALGDNVVSYQREKYRPFFVTLKKPIPITLEVYLFPALNPPGGRGAHEYKINLLLHDHKPRTPKNFPHNENYPILVAYAFQFDVFVLLDAYAHENFTPNTNVQFKDDLVLEPLCKGLCWGQKNNGEVVISASSPNLLKAITHRIFNTTPPIELFT